ncbi:DUF3048 domain-containing protein [Candidatus Dojkabacteria bacterium]|nr:DUF3048 domain-containing protein [Candidatus Dojkabacteria bacterium]
MKYMSTGKTKVITMQEGKTEIKDRNIDPVIVPRKESVTSKGIQFSNQVKSDPTSVTPTVTNTPTDTAKSTKPKVELKPWQKISLSILISAILLGAVSVSMYFYIFTKPISPFQIVNIKESYLEIDNQIYGWNEKVKDITNTLAIPNLPRTEVNPLNGVLYTKTEMDALKKNRPVAVMINNHVQARPQSGLNKADIVYEAVAESGISRYMAIFWSIGPSKIGPVRSARQYYLEWLSPYDPLYIHDGCASTDDPRTNACGNIYSYGIKDLRTYGYWRSSDRFAPHNEYNSIVTAWDYAIKNGWGGFPNIDSLMFKRDAEPQDRGVRTKVNIKHRQDIPNAGLYDSEWTYDTKTNQYLHKIGGQADLDLETGTQVNAKVVVIMEVDLQNANDGHARVIITTIGEGKAVILQDGKIVTGKWKKTSRTERERFYDSSGKELSLNRGRLWITAVPKSQGKFDIIEQ